MLINNLRDSQTQLISSLGASVEAKRPTQIGDWECYSLNYNTKTAKVPVILVAGGPKNMTELKQEAKKLSSCVLFLPSLQKIFIKIGNTTDVISLESDPEYLRVASILKAQNVPDAKNGLLFMTCLKNAIESIRNTTGDFENRGLFSTHYLQNRIFNEYDVNLEIDNFKRAPSDVRARLSALGWDKAPNPEIVTVITTPQDNFNTRTGGGGSAAPSYYAVTELKTSKWVILTNGRRWRLYTTNVSASTTNYFEIVLDDTTESKLFYLAAIFGARAYHDGAIEQIFEEGKKFARGLEENLAAEIMKPNGLFITLIKGILDHDVKRKYDPDELESAKQDALTILYRIWFIAYAESRNLLPLGDKRYLSLSLSSTKSQLDSYESEPKDSSCWESLLELFEGIRNGSPDHNLPQYGGDLFEFASAIDGTDIQNRFIVPVIRDLLEKDGESIDYSSLNVRHLGNIFENLMEYGVRQADRDIMLLEDKNGIREVKSKQDSTYSYKQGDLYLASKGGIALRKSTASYYTPDEIVRFLVGRGLEAIFKVRRKQIKSDLEQYAKTQSMPDRQQCIDRLLDIQVLDPTMGSGHFLVEALNRITEWATEILRENPDHPLLEDLDSDRQSVLEYQRSQNIAIDENLLTYDVLLKRRIMKRCIFGVDLNPMAVELAKLSLWLDSFAIGIPLTYMDHHLKNGDSTIGVFFEDVKDPENHTIDDWLPSIESNTLINHIASSSDVTIQQARTSKDKYEEYLASISPTRRVLDAFTASQIDNSIIPKKSRLTFIHRFARYDNSEDKVLEAARQKVAELSSRHRFFHWELEMRDAFTDSRRGFDIIVGNPPWDKIKLYDDEFFITFWPTFRLLSPKPKKLEVMNLLLQNNNIKNEYELRKSELGEKSRFYSGYTMQGSGDKELSKLVIEKMFSLLSKGGILSMVAPSQILSSISSTEIRRALLEREILSLYVFENRKKIFPIDSRYRFMLLSLRNIKGPNLFPTGFYLHDISSLQDKDRERTKFGTLSKEKIRSIYPNSLIIPENLGTLDIITKMYRCSTLGEGLGADLRVSHSRGFDKTNDSDLFREDGKGWPVHEGKTIHQYNHTWTNPAFTVRQRAGLEREKKPKYTGQHREFYNSYRLVFRNISSSTNMRTMISTIVPPRTFHAHSLYSIILKQDGKLVLDGRYLETISFLCGIFNSTSFDFLARMIVQVNMSTIIKQIPVPTDHKNEISLLAATLTVGHEDFAGFADHMRIPNRTLSVPERIDTTAELDVLVAKSYGLNREEYKTILYSFKSFKENPDLRNADEIEWNNSNLKEFYGEMRRKALEIF